MMLKPVASFLKVPFRYGMFLYKGLLEGQFGIDGVFFQVQRREKGNQSSIALPDSTLTISS